MIPRLDTPFECRSDFAAAATGGGVCSARIKYAIGNADATAKQSPSAQSQVFDLSPLAPAFMDKVHSTAGGPCFQSITLQPVMQVARASAFAVAIWIGLLESHAVLPL